MQTAIEINSHLNNISYYVKSIKELVQKQRELDWNADLRLSDPDNKRFMALNIMESDCVWIESLLKGIHANMVVIIEGEKVKV